jgi:hypothetical protein
MLVVQGVEIPTVCLFMQIRMNLMVLDNIWWRARHIHTILFIQKYFLCNNNFLTFKATLPYNSTLLVLFKVILGSYLHLNMNIVSSHSPLHPSTLFITTLKLS